MVVGARGGSFGRPRAPHAGPTGRWYPGLRDGLTVAVTEKRTREEIDGLAAALGEVLASRAA